MGGKSGVWGIAGQVSHSVLEGDGNSVYSPICVYEQLRMMRLGASGETAEELNAVLRGSPAADDRFGLDIMLESPTAGFKAGLASSVWIDGRAEPANSFIRRCEGEGIPVRLTDLSASSGAEEVSRWISESTEGALSPDVALEGGALACVVSAIYLKDAWRDAFDRCFTRRMSFHAEGGEIDADYMSSEQLLGVSESDFGLAVELPLLNGSIMRLVLPSGQVDLCRALADGTAVEALSDPACELAFVGLRLPKFACETVSDNLASALVGAGFSTAHVPDLIPMTGVEGAAASYVHGARIAVDEDGVEGGAYQYMVACMGIPPEPRVVRFDRPFLFAVVSPTNQPLFLGVVRSPEADPLAWVSYESEDEIGSEGGWIVRDEQIMGICRITMEMGIEREVYSITCGVYGIMVHTAFAGDYDLGVEKYEGMKRDLEECAHLLEDDGFDVCDWCEEFVSKW